MLALAALMMSLAGRAALADSIVLVPIDNRPAVGQFAEMISAIGDVRVVTPPPSFLGQFLTPGSPEAILTWLEEQDFSDVKSVIVSTDMIAYGGLIASRTNSVSREKAMSRLQRLVRLRKRWPGIRLYGFSAIMRLTPTATRSALTWREPLARYVELKQLFDTAPTAYLKSRLASLRAKVPAAELRNYMAARSRNHEVQRSLVKMAQGGAFDTLLIGQDDATTNGPHVPEVKALRKLIAQTQTEGKVLFCEGIDQHAAVLVSRALLKEEGWVPRVRIVYSDQATSAKVAAYESKPLRASLREQLVASGAEPAVEGADYDYSLYVNTPNPRPSLFALFQRNMGREIDQGLPVAVADVNLGKDGTCDPALFDTLCQNGRIMKVLSFAGWNSAGNTMGTSIPAANVYLLARRTNVNPLKREIAQREFLLHRVVNDYAYHRFTRPVAYSLIESKQKARKEEFYGETYYEINDFVRRDLSKQLEKLFKEQFYGRRFFAGNKSYVLSGLDDVSINLPWPRAYEVSLHFRLRIQEQIRD